MTRTLSGWAAGRGEERLNALIQAVGKPERYKNAMHDLGVELGRHIAGRLTPGRSVCVVCTVEDADFLTRGVIEELGKVVGPGAIRLVCFWNLREKLPGKRSSTSIAPIIRRYVEPIAEKTEVLLVLKSIIAGGCTVRTNIEELVHRLEPARIVVAAPVVLKGSEEEVRDSFDRPIATRFEFVHLAEDTERDAAGMVRPGIGGDVYSLLGFKDQDDKNRYCPDLLIERQAALGH